MSATPAISELLEEMLSAGADERLALLQQIEDPGAVILALVEEAAKRVGKESTRAIEATGVVVELADAAGAGLGRARARRAHARALSYAGQYPEALVAVMRGIDIATTENDPIEIGRGRLASMHALGELGRLGEAIAAGTEARDLFQSAGVASLAARADINLGITYQRQDQPAAALQCFLRARPHLEDPLTLGTLDNNRGEALVAVNDFTEAERAYKSALLACQTANATIPTAIVEGNLADLATRMGRLQLALYYFEGARRRLETVHSPAHLARVLAEQAEAKAVLGLPVEALDDYQKALRELDRCGTALEAARARCGMGLVLVRLERAAEAETALAAAAAGFEELGHATARAKVDLVRAELALANGQIDEARRKATRALAALYERPADAAATRHLLARVAMRSGDVATAEADLAAALAAAGRLDLAPLLADIYDTRGRLRLDAGRPDDAVDDLTQAVAHIERVRGSLQADRFRTAFLGGRSSTHETLVGALLDRGGLDAIDRAFHVAEQAKSRSLLDQVFDVTDAPSEGRPTGDQEETRLRDDFARVRSELDALYSRIADEQPAASDTVSSAAWLDAIHLRERELSGLESRLAATRAAGWLYAAPRTLDGLQAHLEEGRVIIEYFVVDGRVLAFVLEKNRTLVRRDLASVTEVTDRLHRFRFQIDRALRPEAMTGRRAGRLLADALNELAALDALILAPLRQRIAGASRLTIVPHGPLHLVPFQALRGGDRFLIQDHEIHTVPSASLFAHLQETEPPFTADPRPLVVGVADEDAPRVHDEAQFVAQLLGAKRLIGEDATAEALIGASANASVIHFAGHGRYLRGNPFGSGIRLADRWFTVRDIGSLRLNADLVTLSGCETGLNLVHAGDELIGLLRSFFAAGARSMLVSQWRVDDASAARFMSRFYTSLAAARTTGLSKAGLVRDAQLAMMAEQPHPAFWAPFTLVGRP